MKPTLRNKVAKFLIGMNFIKHRNSGLIVQGEKITMCKHMNSIQTTPRVSHEENLIENILPKEVEIYQNKNLEMENVLIKQKLEALIEKLKKYRTIGENPIKNINRVNIICILGTINTDLQLTCPIIKAST